MTDLKDRFTELFDGEPGAPHDIDRIIEVGRRTARRRTALTAVVGGAATATVAAGVAVPVLLDNGPAAKPGNIQVGAEPTPSTHCLLLKNKAGVQRLTGHFSVRKVHGGLIACSAGSTGLPTPSHEPPEPAAPRYHYTESPQSIAARLGDHLAAQVTSLGLSITYTRPFAQETSTIESGHPAYYDGNVDVHESDGYADIGVQVTHKATTQVPFQDPCPATGPSRCQQTTLPDGSVLRTARVPAGRNDVVLTAEVARPDGVVVQAQESNYPFGPDSANQAHGKQPLSMDQLIKLAEDPKFTF